MDENLREQLIEQVFGVNPVERTTACRAVAGQVKQAIQSSTRRALVLAISRIYGGAILQSVRESIHDPAIEGTDLNIMELTEEAMEDVVTAVLVAVEAAWV